MVKLHPNLFNLLDLIFPFRRYSKEKKINNICYLMDLFCKLFLSKINFNVIFEKSIFRYSPTNDENKITFDFYIDTKYYLIDLQSSIKRIIEKGTRPMIFFEMKQDLIKDPKKDPFFWNYYIYLVILDIIENKREYSIIKKHEIEIIFKKIGKPKSKPLLQKNKELFEISRFFNENDNSSLFGKCFGCVFSFDENFFNYIITFVNPIERHLMNLSNALYSILAPKYIEPIINLSESMKEFASKSSILWSVDNFNPEPSEVHLYNSSLKREKSIIDAVFSQDIQIKEEIKAEFLEYFRKAQDKIDALIINEVKDENERKIKERLKQCRNLLNNIIPSNNEILIMKNKLAEYISQFSENLQIPSEKDIEDIEIKINQFIELTNKKEGPNIESLIDWPDISINYTIINETENTINFELLLWYSKIMKEFKLIDLDIRNNLIKSIMNLNDNNEILPILNLLMNINSDRISNIDRKNKQIIFGTLNAIFIFKLYKINKLEFLWKIDDFINNFKKREEISEPYFIHKVYDNLKSLDDKYIIYIPKFKKSDLIFLFINCTKNDYRGNREFKLGPLLEEFKYMSVKDLNPLIDKFLDNDKEITCAEILDDICKVIYNTYLNVSGKKKELKDHDSIIIALKNVENECTEKINEFKNINRDKTKEIIEQENKIKVSQIILTIYDLAKLMDNNFPEYKFEFDDLEFLKDKLDQEFINKYPTLFYFLNKNLVTYNQLKDNYFE